MATNVQFGKPNTWAYFWEVRPAWWNPADGAIFTRLHYLGSWHGAPCGNTVEWWQTMVREVALPDSVWVGLVYCAPYLRTWWLV